MCTSFKNNVRFSSSLNAHQTLSPFFTVARAGKRRQRDRETERQTERFHNIKNSQKHQKLSLQKESKLRLYHLFALQSNAT